jgi:hypothetical protein
LLTRCALPALSERSESNGCQIAPTTTAAGTRERHVRYADTLSVHHLWIKRLRFAEVNEILIGRLVRQELRQILEHVGRHRRRNAAEERTELLLASLLAL